MRTVLVALAMALILPPRARCGERILRAQAGQDP
jgi:hypothetical protein